MLYSIKIRNGVWLKWSDECWYETCKFDYRVYTYEKALQIAKQLRKHYIYHCWICSDNGEELIDNINYSFKKPIINDVIDNIVNTDIEDCDDIFSNMSSSLLNIINN